jgi:hypothetical protein
VAVDRMDWHYAGDYPDDLSNENSGTHIGFYLAWIINNNLESDLHRDESASELASVRERKMSGREFLITMCDEKFIYEDLNKEGHAFTVYYYEAEANGYFYDYGNNLTKNLPSIYHVENSWENYDVIAPVITEAYRLWKENHI